MRIDTEYRTTLAVSMAMAIVFVKGLTDTLRAQVLNTRIHSTKRVQGTKSQ